MAIDVTIGSTEILLQPANVGVWPFDALLTKTVQHLVPATAKSTHNYHKQATQKAQPPAIKNDPLVMYVYTQANKVHDLLKATGLGEPASSYGTYQSYFETEAFHNNGYKQYNNASGIKYNHQRGARPGPNGYAIFDTWHDWANAMHHELTKGANPAGAASLEDYNARLAANHYHESDTNAYLEGLKRARYVLKQLPASDRAGYNPDTGQSQDKQDMDIPGSKDYSDPTKWPAWLKWSAGITTGLVVLKLITN